MDDPRLPVTLLTGFLGAGKTTLLNAVLRDGAAGPVAVVVNEFGEAGLDHDLIETSTEEVVLMRSGCLCCSVLGDLNATIAGLMTRRAAGEIAFDRVVIETTGLADPGPILRAMQVDGFLARQTRLDGVVTIADARHGQRTLDAQFEAVSQAAMADLIVLSKTDIATGAEVAALTDRLRALNPTARILPAVMGQGAGAALFGSSGLRRGVGHAGALDWVRPAAPMADPLANLSGLAAAPPPAPHDARIGTAAVTLEAPIPEVAFDIWLETLMAFRGPNILRVKGIVFLQGIADPFVFHGVGDVVDAPVPLTDWPRGERTSRIVVIARDMSRAEIERGFDILHARPTSDETP